MRKRKVFTVLMFAVSFAFAGGFQVNLQGVKQAGMGHCGTAFANDNYAVFFNPASISFLHSSDSTDNYKSVSISLLPVFARTLYQLPQSNYSERTINNIGTPFNFSSVYRYKKAGFALSAYTPFGSTVEWPSDWRGKFLLQKISLRTIFFQPTFSYQIHEKISIGVGVILATGNFSLQRKLPVQQSNGEWGQVLLEGETRGYGFNSGIYFDISENFKAGISYRSKVNAKVENGTATFVVPEMLVESFPAKSFNTSLTLPSVSNLGVMYSVNKNLKFLFDINYVGWKVYDSLIIDFDINTERLSDLRSARNYKSSFIFRIGSEYSIQKNLQIRAGAYYDQSPVRSGYLTPETPDSDKIAFTCGASIKVSNRLSIDASLMYIEGMRREDTNIETSFEAIYKSKALVPGISLNLILP